MALYLLQDFIRKEFVIGWEELFDLCYIVEIIKARFFYSVWWQMKPMKKNGHQSCYN